MIVCCWSTSWAEGKEMDSARSWFHKFQPRDRVRSSTKNKESMASEDDESKDSQPPLTAEEASNITKQKVAAAKQYIENHYKEQMKNLQERKERYVLAFTCFKSSFIIHKIPIRGMFHLHKALYKWQHIVRNVGYVSPYLCMFYWFH